MADDSSKGLKDNIIKGPWKRVKSVSMAQTQKLSQDMMFCDDVAESVMIPMIHNLAENGVDISSKEFIRHVGFIDECVKSTLFQSMGYDHPLGELVKYLVGATKSKDNGKIFTSFKGDTMIDILEFLGGDEDE